MRFRDVLLPAVLAGVMAAGPAAAQEAKGVETKGLAPYDLLGSTASVTSGSAFNPAISVIPEFFYYTDDRRGTANAFPLEAEGFAGTPQGESRVFSRGFNLGETELSLSASADPYFDATAIFSFAPDGVAVEEAFARTRSLPGGLALKAGKFYSGIGYLNEQHPHQWDFYDRPLAYQALLGGQVNEAGVQLTWLPRGRVYLLFGAEALQGNGPGISNVVPDPGGTLGTGDRAGPRLFTAFVRLAPDVGYSDALQVGAWYARSLQQQETSTLFGTSALDGTAWATGLSAVFKHDAGRQGGARSWQLQGEYLYRAKSLEVVSAGDPLAAGTPVDSRQDGLYVQGTYGFAPRWTASARWDLLGLVNVVDTRDAEDRLRSTSRVSAGIVYNPTEFSRIRVQYTWGSVPLAGEERQTCNQFALQLQLSVGVHGAHRF